MRKQLSELVIILLKLSVNPNREKYFGKERSKEFTEKVLALLDILLVVSQEKEE